MPGAPAAVAVALLAASAGCAHLADPIPVAPPTQLVTGSRIPRQVDPVTGRVLTESAVRTYTALQLAETGDPNLAGALRRVDTSFR